MAAQIRPRHDGFGRIIETREEDHAAERYLHPHNGKVLPLVVQQATSAINADKLGGSEATGTWKRSGRVSKTVSPIVRVAQWARSSVFAWVPACILLVVVLLLPQNAEGTPKNGGNYDPVRAFDREYPLVARNRKERRPENNEDEGSEHEFSEGTAFLPQSPGTPGDVEMTAMTPFIPTTRRVESFGSSTIAEAVNGDNDDEDDHGDLLQRDFGPRWLCFLKYDSEGRPVGYETRMVADWVREHGDDADTDFVFLSYTRQQFCVALPQELAKWKLDSATHEALYQIAPVDREKLQWHGIEAAHAAGKGAFWLDFECIRDADGLSKATSQSTDVYRISDTVRAAHSLVILVGPPVTSKYSAAGPEAYSPETMMQWLQEWGMRLWTLPEILLISPEKRVKIYAIGGPRPPAEWPKRQFASRRVWRDAVLVRQLIDHYESSIHLQPVEFVSIALRCFTRRYAGDWCAADIVYALMGLLRRRPAVSMSDTSFIAFAKLSLANDSEALLERFICLQPRRLGRPWHEQDDFWGCKLWDIEPRCQIAGVVDDETVILDDAYGATIQWDRMEQVYFFTRPTSDRKVYQWLVHGIPVYLLIGIFLTWLGITEKMKDSARFEAAAKVPESPEVMDEIRLDLDASKIILWWGWFILALATAISLVAPALILKIYVGKYWATQAMFVGMEGVPEDLGLIEECLFTSNRGRLKWSVAGSTHSRHALVNGDCVGLRPPLPNYRNDDAASGQLPTFTLIDTHTMTAMAFQAARPPTTVVICGQEGGMQRAALCSYDWEHNTFAREQVVRLPTTVLDRMSRMGRFRFSLKRRAEPSDARPI